VRVSAAVVFIICRFLIGWFPLAPGLYQHFASVADTSSFTGLFTEKLLDALRYSKSRSIHDISMATTFAVMKQIEQDTYAARKVGREAEVGVQQPVVEHCLTSGFDVPLPFNDHDDEEEEEEEESD
jgi:hypothetical protein